MQPFPVPTAIIPCYGQWRVCSVELLVKPLAPYRLHVQSRELDSFLGGPDLACRADCVDRDIFVNSTSFTHLVWYLAATISLLCETFFLLAIDPLIGANLCSTWQFQFIFQGRADLGKHTSRPWSP